MKLFKLFIKNKDVTQFVTRINISGDDTSASRSCDFALVTSATDKNLPKINIEQGSEISVLNNNGKEIFFGYVKAKDKSLKENVINIKSFDSFLDFNNSTGSYDFENENPSEIAKKVFKDGGLEVGECVSAKKITRTYDMASLYGIVYTSYYLDYEQTKKPYILRLVERKACVLEKGKVVAKYVLNPKENLIDVKYGESSENAVNKVKIFDENGKEIGQITEGKGNVSVIYRKEKGEDAKARAKAMLKGLERVASLTTFGDKDLITGNAVMIKDPHTGLNGKFFIISDSHKFEKGIYMCDLELNFENIMEEKSAGSDKKEDEEDSLSASGGASGGKRSAIGAIAKRHAGERYDQATRMNEGVSDCSSFVYKVTMEYLGKNWRGTWAPSTYTMAQRTDLWYEIPLSQAKPWDILWTNGHTEFLGDDGRTYGAHTWGTPSGPGGRYNPNGWNKAFRIRGK